LKDFSKVGYGEGMARITSFPVKINVKDLGAKGDGLADDTEPFRKAIEACPAGGAVWVPDGTYKLTIDSRKDQKWEY
jgi:polygalacturonase